MILMCFRLKRICVHVGMWDNAHSKCKELYCYTQFRDCKIHYQEDENVKAHLTKELLIQPQIKPVNLVLHI